MSNISTRLFIPVLLLFFFRPCRAQVSSSYQWTWMGGSQQPNQFGHYGIKGVEDPANMPGARDLSNSWVDGNDNLWLFGGSGYAASGSAGDLNDLWKYNTHTNAWTWVSGDSVVNSPGKYGPRDGPAGADNSITPSGRHGATAGYYNGNGGTGPELILFGGGSFIGGTNLRNDCWVYSINKNQWMWVSGDSTVNGGSFPSARWEPAGWVAGNVFRVYGGLSSGGKLLDDYWEFDLSSSPGGGWTALYRDDSPILPVASQYQLNKAGSKVGAIGFYDPTGNHSYLFGGSGYENDLWQSTGAYSTTGYGEWKWIKGDSTSGTPGSYGSLGVASPGNLPPSRHDGPIARDIDGKFILFGGMYQGTTVSYDLNDVWGYDPASNAWTWLGGSSGSGGSAGNYGALGIQSANNLIGSRYQHVTWITSEGEMYVFGGVKAGAGMLNDLWKYSAPLALAAADSLALVDLYNSTGGPQWKHNTGWLTSAPVTTWYGVTMQSGRVTNLALMNNGLNGILPASLANLSALRGFYVMGNQLRGALPALGNLPAFAGGQFNISNNAFNFDGIEQQVQAHPGGVYYPQSRLTIHHRGDTLSVGAGGTLLRNSYTWWNNGVLAGRVLGDSTFVATASGDYSVNVTNSVATQLVLTSDLLPVAGDTSIAAGCADETVRLTGSHCLPVQLSVDSNLRPVTILWFRNDTLVRTVTGGWQTGGTVIAGGHGAGSGASQLHNPMGIFLDAQDNLYIADDSNRRVQKWARGTTAGTTVIGGGDYPLDLTGDPLGNLYVLGTMTDTYHSRVQKWSPGAGNGITVTESLEPEQYWGIDRDAAGNIYLTDDVRAMVLKWTPGASYGIVVAGGNGAGDNTNQLGFPNGVAVDKQGSLYIADESPNYSTGGRIVKWYPGVSQGIVLGGEAGSGSAANQIKFSTDIAVDGLGNVYIADADNHRVQCWAPGATSGITVADGNLTPAAQGPFQPWGVKLDESGNLYAADTYNNRVLRFARTIDHSFTDSLPGTYKAVLVNASGCYYTSPPFVVQAPPDKPVITQQGAVLLSSAALGNQWFFNTIAVPGATGARFIPTVAGGYSVMDTVSGCISPMSDVLAYSPGPASAMTSIYPNPAKDVLTIVSHSTHPVTVQVSDMYGTTLVTVPGVTGVYPLSISHYGAGMYVLYVVDPVTGQKEQKTFLKL